MSERADETTPEQVDDVDLAEVDDVDDLVASDQPPDGDDSQLPPEPPV